MKDFMKLLKAVEASSLVVNRKKKGKTVKPHAFGISIILTAIVLNLTFLYQFYELISKGLQASVGMDVFRSFFRLSFTSYFLYGFFMCLVFAFSVFFRSKDDVFLSMPISGSRFFLAKLVLTLYINMVYGGLTILVTGICLCVMLKLSFLSYFSVFIVFLSYVVVTPCLSFLVADFFSLFLNLKTSRTPSIILQTIFGVIAGVCAMFVSLLSSSVGDTPTTSDFASAVERMSGNFIWCSWIGFFPQKAVMSDGLNGMLSLLIHICISAAIVMIVLLVARKTYLVNLGKTYSSKKKKMDTRKLNEYIKKTVDSITNYRKISLRKELSNYRDDKTILVNGFVYPMTMFLSFGSTSLALYLNKAFSDNAWAYQMICFGGLLISMSFYMIPFASMSMERQNLSYMKSFPISLKNLMIRKLSLCFLMILPLAILFGTVFLFLAPFSLDYLFSVLIISLLYPLFVIVFSFYMGVRFPNFNYGNAAELMKKGAGPTLCLVGTFLSCIIGEGIMVFSHFVLGNYFYGAMIDCVVFAALTALCYILAKQRMNHLLNSEIL